jgi:hypothetical protein
MISMLNIGESNSLSHQRNIKKELKKAKLEANPNLQRARVHVRKGLPGQGQGLEGDLDQGEEPLGQGLEGNLALGADLQDHDQEEILVLVEDLQDPDQEVDLIQAIQDQDPKVILELDLEVDHILVVPDQDPNVDLNIAPYQLVLSHLKELSQGDLLPLGLRALGGPRIHQDLVIQRVNKFHVSLHEKKGQTKLIHHLWMKFSVHPLSSPSMMIKSQKQWRSLNQDETGKRLRQS